MKPKLGAKLVKLDTQRLIAVVIVIVLAAVGVRLSVSSHAQSPYTSAIASSGTLGGSATAVTDPTASTSESVRFGSLTSTVPPSSCTPADPLADQAAKNLLNLLCNLPRNSTHRILSGQFIGTPNNTYGGVASDLDKTITLTGKTPSIVGYDFDWAQNGSATCDPTNQQTADWQTLANDAQTRGSAGNIIAVSDHLNNPASGCASNVSSGISASSPGNVLTPGTQANNNLNASLNYEVDFALQLQAKGIPILYRPYCEMNGNWFWWDQISWFPQLWQYTFNYLTSHGVHNAIYVYAPDYAQGYTNLETYYPGSKYVDVLAVDTYEPDTSMNQGQWITAQQTYASFASGKPFGIAEVGYNSSYESPNQYDNNYLLQALKQTATNAPGPSYFMSWMTPQGIANQNNLSNLYQDSSIANLGDYPSVNQ